MKKISCFIILILFLLPTVVYAKSLKDNPIGKAFIWLGFPENWLEGNSILYYGFIPFLGIWMIVYGFLELIRIFDDNKPLYTILSFIIAFSTIPLGIFVMLVGMIFSVMGIFSVFAFALLFFVGIAAITWRKFSGYSATFGNVNILRRSVNTNKQLQENILENLNKWVGLAVTHTEVLSIDKPKDDDSYPPSWNMDADNRPNKGKIKHAVSRFRDLEDNIKKTNKELREKGFD